ncbi:hypothetical protein GH714_039702 [Hevea brasiliensis]|uniref:Alpha-L-arabinofuranosidase B arabinose-binding domain-containing protein n=1 Tax=Hevea brasiliensis TaxID=3981 RepID=A0A6A6MV36_HEVBR|nr:hypothetical protein GH714_039702 [Hevea brasiliensis]
MKGFSLFKFLVLFFLSLLCGLGVSKECTNTPTQLSSHTFRYELLSSNNETWKKEMFARYHLIPTDDSAWSNLLPRKILKEEDEFDWAVTYRKMKSLLESSEHFLKEVSLHNVRLDSSSIQWRAQQTNLEYLLMLDVDRLVWSFRKTAGLPTPGTAYGGWEAPDCELRGHFVGHYLSASAHMWASTHNDTVQKKMSAVVSALSACQEKIGTGYLSAFPSELFDRFEAIKPVWAPYYTIHKILAGLLDQYTFADNVQALKMVKWMVEYFYNRVQNVVTKYSVERHFLSLNEETGRMDTGHRGSMRLPVLGADDISGFHANTHIPIVIGSQMRYEVTGDTLYKEIGTFFMDIVNSSHSYATGGTSVSEFWSDPKRLASTLSSENEESCTTYNMLKIISHFYSHASVLNKTPAQMLSTCFICRHPKGNGTWSDDLHASTKPGSSKARSYHGWGTVLILSGAAMEQQFDTSSTGIESFSKLGDSIYFEEEGQVPGLYVIQYVSSSLDWKAGQIVLDQQVDSVVSWDPYLRVTLTFSPNKGTSQPSTLNFRIPIWTYSDGAKATLNAQSLSVPAPGNFLSITRKWSSGDKLTLQLPISFRTESIKDDRSEYASVQAILYGPYLLAGHTIGDWNIKSGSADSLSDWITPIPPTYNNYLVSFSQQSGDSALALTNSNQTITMQNFPKSGTDASVYATFRLILNGSSSSELSTIENAIGNYVMLEPFDLPGMVLVQQGEDDGLAVASSDSGDGSSIFRLVSGLDGKDGTISLESISHEGCFVFSGVDYQSGTSLKLSCNSESSDIHQGASFVMNKGLSEFSSLVPVPISRFSSLVPVPKDRFPIIGECTVYEKPTKVSKGSTLNWEKISNQITNAAKFNAPQGLLKEVSLHDVRLEPNSLHWTAQQTNLEYLLMLDVDRLVWSFRKTAGLPTLGTPYGGWEAPDIELRGHFVGHYLSAAAKMWASTQNGTLQEKMSAVVSILSDCQQKMGTGYLSAFPSELFDRYEAVVYVWAPYYTIHKIMSGLLDQHTIAKNPQALKMLTWMVDYFYNRIQNVILQFSIARHYAALNEETGGMNDLLYRLYSITKDPKHLVMAHLFDKPCFLGELAVQANNLADFHANTHIPVVIGSQTRYEVTGDPLYKSIATYFMDIVNSTHTFATGGTSIDEHWKEPSRLASHLMPENEESCTTYNMLKVSRNLFRWTKETAYADHYERALTNGVLSIQRGTEPGVMIYFLPLGPGHSKAVSNQGWGTPFDSFWCCYGTAIESFSKLGDSIYFEEEGKVPSLYIIQYISSSLNWVSGQIVLNQKVDPVVSWDPFLKVTITTSTLQNSKGGNRLSTLNLRIPIWTHLNGAKAELNNINLKLPAPGNFLSITRYWAPNDTLNLQLPIDMRLEAIKDDRPEYASIKAILYGPYLLAGHSSGNWDIKPGMQVPFQIG